MQMSCWLCHGRRVGRRVVMETGARGLRNASGPGFAIVPRLSILTCINQYLPFLFLKSGQDELELRGLSKQGNKNEIMKRLLDACAAE
jgi:hypothetical protein